MYYTGTNKREYSRLKVQIPLLIYPYSTNTEINCDIIDLSEEGLCISINKAEIPNIFFYLDDKLQVVFVDSYVLGNDIITETISDVCIIKHIEYVANTIHIGCKVLSTNFKEYVRHKKLAYTLISRKSGNKTNVF